MTASVAYFLLLLTLSSRSKCFHDFIVRSSSNTKRIEKMFDASQEIWVKIQEDKTPFHEMHHNIDGIIYQSEIVVNHVNDNDKVLIERDGKLVNKKSGRLVGVALHLHRSEEQSKALSLIGSVEIVLIYCEGDWTMIPVENLISACGGTSTRLAVFVDDRNKLPGVMFALQVGPHIIVLKDDKDLIEEALILSANRRINGGSSTASHVKQGSSSSSPHSIQLSKAAVTGIQSGGVGDRVCVDLIQLLEPGEGLLIGSSSKLLALVHGETLPSEFVPSRPFRVNAGPVHSYVVLADRSTKYLCELAAGDAVLVVSMNQLLSSGEGEGLVVCGGRAVTVGRCKVEPRPVLMVSFETTPGVDGRAHRGQVFLQQAETVRLLAAGSITEGSDKGVEGVVSASEGVAWRALSVTEVAVGDKIFVSISELGTHVGRRIASVVNEK